MVCGTKDADPLADYFEVSGADVRVMYRPMSSVQRLSLRIPRPNLAFPVTAVAEFSEDHA